MSTSLPYTSYPDVDETLSALLDGVRSVLKSDFIGLYLYGSLATGDFDPETSDGSHPSINLPNGSLLSTSNGVT